jgi:hypothetical protein
LSSFDRAGMPRRAFAATDHPLDDEGLGRYFLAAGFALSCLGFIFFVSFFWEWLPLPMIASPEVA